MFSNQSEPFDASNLSASQRIWAARFGYSDGRLSWQSLRNTDRSATLGATTIANDSDLANARVGFHAAFLQSLEGGADPIEALALTLESDGREEVVSFMGDIPGFEEWVGERKMAGLDAHSLPTLRNIDWSSGLRLKANDIKDDKLALLPAVIRGLAGKARKHRGELLAELLVNGFAGNVYPKVSNGLAHDGGFFFDTTRPTGSNKLTVALDAAGLAAAALLLDSMTTFGGDPLNLVGTHLIVGTKLRAIAEDLLKLNFIPNVAGTATQSNRNVGRYELIVSPRIRGVADDYWFLADLSQAYKPLIFQLREEISTSARTAPEVGSVFGRNEHQFGAQARYNVGYFDPRLIVGSQVA